MIVREFLCLRAKRAKFQKIDPIKRGNIDPIKMGNIDLLKRVKYWPNKRG